MERGQSFKASYALPRTKKMKGYSILLIVVVLVSTFRTIVTHAVNPADIYYDHKVDWLDLKVMNESWLSTSTTPADIDNSGDVNGVDFAILAGNWLWQNEDELASLSLEAMDFAEGQLAATVGSINNTQYPIYTQSYINWNVSTNLHWASGFFPGCLWLVYEYGGDPNFLNWAESWMTGLEIRKNDTSTHDLGFIINNTFGNAYRLTGNTDYRDIVLQAGQSLATRFDPTVGCIRSWDWGSWEFPVIIDNMMNLEILFWASRNGGQSQWYDIAVSHAYKTAEQHVRANGSTYQLVDFDANTGALIDKGTWQGYATESTWARGQAWALYGFTMTYRETSDPNFLLTAEKVADYFVDNLPSDSVAYWDFDAPGIPNTTRDTSAAAIAASGLLELSSMASDQSHQVKYYNAALEILTSLCTRMTDGYLAQDTDSNPLGVGILVQGCYHHPNAVSDGSIFDESLIWGDYYLIEALLRYQNIPSP
jgi:unsaturated chondroitin disaccharide hydrolase